MIPTTPIQTYIQNAQPHHQAYLKQIDQLIQELLPQAKGKISYQMPTYWDQHNIIHFAANQKHLGLYPGAKAIVYFADELDQLGLHYSKGAIQIPYNRALPLDFIIRLIKKAWELNH
ncbi:iron chaperone [Vaginisenegalia massiliensis]|uniref:iron chaperone n=1 Tax=Vaginisenegalia massiliensis TaxID=2058294 RepID=UPI000F54377E|nr:DUF1801 domain-containing protein [Vaginisenegalia massiliensis]